MIADETRRIINDDAKLLRAIADHADDSALADIAAMVRDVNRHGLDLDIRAAACRAAMVERERIDRLCREYAAAITEDAA